MPHLFGARRRLFAGRMGTLILIGSGRFSESVRPVLRFCKIYFKTICINRSTLLYSAKPLKFPSHSAQNSSANARPNRLMNRFTTVLVFCFDLCSVPSGRRTFRFEFCSSSCKISGLIPITVQYRLRFDSLHFLAVTLLQSPVRCEKHTQRSS